ncbi:hypothetical protein EVAR_60330_1 [Eumeta japonica]|uniref:Uncharacterized protein n=1 Tax=Eumeta variegata TaxID=151549 RepID=A0A4C1Z4B8_EUMVA|nr:hypothetical protein EVAR_60330_1 [Eumeta japonica]
MSTLLKVGVLSAQEYVNSERRQSWESYYVKYWCHSYTGILKVSYLQYLTEKISVRYLFVILFSADVRCPANYTGPPPPAPRPRRTRAGDLQIGKDVAGVTDVTSSRISRKIL